MAIMCDGHLAFEPSLGNVIAAPVTNEDAHAVRFCEDVVDERRFTLDSAMAAHALVEQGGAAVKVVIDVAA